jgi:S-DNA-T family DNA segregation ATPase FtsK/SpoIIIE
MNIVTKGDAKKLAADGKPVPMPDGIQPLDPNALSIKMVSDISGKRDLPIAAAAGPKQDVNISLAAMAKPAAPQLTKPAAPVEEAQPVDLSVRNYPDWVLPGLDLLDQIKPKQQDPKEVIERKAKAILETLRSFNIEAKILGYSIGPSVTQYFIDPAAGIKFSKIANLSKDLALTLASPSDLRIELVPGKSYIGIDVPNDIRQGTQLRESIQPVFKDPDKFNLGLAVGIDVTGQPVARDLQKAPHLLVAGATGQGKSVLINAFIVSLLMRRTPDELKFIMIDPKMVEMAPYDGIPHLLTPPITDMSKASNALKWAVNEMEERYKLLKDARVRNIEDYVKQTGSLMPYIVIVIDEFADLMMQYRQEVESSIIRLAQKARAIGIHLIVATQRPTADVITGLIRSNIPARVALTVATGIDSRVILDATGAETLLGKGDLLFKTATDLKPVRIQGLYMPDNGPDSEFHRILNFIKQQAPDVQYNDDAILTIPVEGGEGGEGGDFMSDDPLFRQAAEIVIGAQKGSASLLQTKMKIGYARAARLVDELEMAGIVGPQDGPRPREVLVTDADAFFNAQQAAPVEGV